MYSVTPIETLQTPKFLKQYAFIYLLSLFVLGIIYGYVNTLQVLDCDALCPLKCYKLCTPYYGATMVVVPWKVRWLASKADPWLVRDFRHIRPENGKHKSPFPSPFSTLSLPYTTLQYNTCCWNIFLT